MYTVWAQRNNGIQIECVLSYIHHFGPWDPSYGWQLYVIVRSREGRKQQIDTNKAASCRYMAWSGDKLDLVMSFHYTDWTTIHLLLPRLHQSTTEIRLMRRAWSHKLYQLAFSLVPTELWSLNCIYTKHEIRPHLWFERTKFILIKP